MKKLILAGLLFALSFALCANAVYAGGKDPWPWNPTDAQCRALCPLGGVCPAPSICVDGRTDGEGGCEFDCVMATDEESEPEFGGVDPRWVYCNSQCIENCLPFTCDRDSVEFDCSSRPCTCSYGCIGIDDEQAKHWPQKSSCERKCLNNWDRGEIICPMGTCVSAEVDPRDGTCVYECVGATDECEG